jgi:hypothetical protein
MNQLINIQAFNASIFRKGNGSYLYIYNSNYYCIIKVLKPVKIVNSTFIKITNSSEKIQSKINFFLKQFYICSFTKIKFTGKGYKIKKNKPQGLVMLFNRAHTTTLWWSGLFLKKLKKYKLYLKYTSRNVNIIQTIINVRPINIFTKKGLRIARQVLKKKKGKK